MSASASTSLGSSNKRKQQQVYLRSSDEDTIEAEEGLVAESRVLRSHIQNSNRNADLLVELNNLDSATLSLVMDFCRNRPRPVIRDHFALQQILNAHDNQFITNRVNTPETLLNLKIAAETLEIQSLLDLTLRRIGLQDSGERIGDDLERQRKLADFALLIVAISVILIFLILATFVIYRAIHNRYS